MGKEIQPKIREADKLTYVCCLGLLWNNVFLFFSVAFTDQKVYSQRKNATEKSNRKWPSCMWRRNLMSGVS